MCSLINKQLLLTAYAYLCIMEQQKGKQGSEALRVESKEKKVKKLQSVANPDQMHKISTILVRIGKKNLRTELENLKNTLTFNNMSEEAFVHATVDAIFQQFQEYPTLRSTKLNEVHTVWPAYSSIMRPEPQDRPHCEHDSAKKLPNVGYLVGTGTEWGCDKKSGGCGQHWWKALASIDPDLAPLPPIENVTFCACGCHGAWLPGQIADESITCDGCGAENLAVSWGCSERKCDEEICISCLRAKFALRFGKEAAEKKQLGNEMELWANSRMKADNR